MPKLLWKKLDKREKAGSIEAPSYLGDAGFNLFTSKYAELRSYIPTQISCDISIAIPDGYFAIPIARSSAVKLGIMVYPTLIDSGYRGPIFIFAVLMTCDNPVKIPTGTSIAQLALFRNLAPEIELEQADQLTVTDRNENGFGSSGGTIP